MISPPVAGAVNVFMKKDSPESERLSPFRMPPCVVVSIWVPAVMLSMAPPSQRICSLGAMRATATVKAGPFSNVTSMYSSSVVGAAARGHAVGRSSPPGRFIGHGTHRT